jgi:hypothetical protein
MPDATKRVGGNPKEELRLATFTFKKIPTPDQQAWDDIVVGRHRGLGAVWLGANLGDES